MPRLFTGIEIPPDVALSLTSLRGGLPGARWIDPENYHITLRFIGDIPQATAAEIADALERIDRRAFDIALDGVAALGTRKPHSVVARVVGSPALSELHAEHERIMQRIGLPAEGRKFTPHVTLARLRGASTRDLAGYLALRAAFGTRPFPVERFVLYSSRDSVGGGPYVVEEAYPLARQAGGAAARQGGAEWLGR